MSSLAEYEDLLHAELSDRLRFETLLADLAARLISVQAEDLNEEIHEAMRALCSFLGVERSSIWQPSANDPTNFVLTHLVGSTAGRTVPASPKLTELWPWALRRLLRGETVVMTDVDSLPPEAARDAESWRYWGAKSSLCLPLSIAGTVVGILTFAALADHRDWPESIVARCRLIASVFASVLARHRSEQALSNSEARYRSIAGNLPGVIYQFVATPDGRYYMRHVDDKALDVCGLPAEPLETFFDRFTACIGREDRSAVLDSVHRAVAAASTWEREFRFLNPTTGEELYFKAISQPARMGNELVFSGLILDITSRMRAEVDLRRSLEEVRRLQEQLHHENVYLRQEVQALQGSMPIIGNSPALHRVLEQAQQVAATDSSVLILGETGTGKELLASYLHSIGKRAGKPFIVANVAAIPATLLENELFGREKGAYTGALTRQIGRFELADGGILFLDEIGELPQETQVKLLRVLQSGTFERLGSSQTIKVNVQVIAATNRKLSDLIRTGAFRQDLYYRLNVFPITLPPLRDRIDDIPLLVWAFVREFAETMGKSIERIRRTDLDALVHYRWPGNIRELRNVIERSVILTQGTELRVSMPEDENNSSGDGVGSHREGESPSLRDVQRAHIQRVLHDTGGRIRGPRGAAQILGLKPTTLASLMQRLGIQRKVV